jgi:hypothetical protein
LVDGFEETGSEVIVDFESASDDFVDIIFEENLSHREGFVKIRVNSWEKIRGADGDRKSQERRVAHECTRINTNRINSKAHPMVL